MELLLETRGIPAHATSAAPSFNQTSIDPEYAEPHDRRILIVDDDEPVRSLLASYLSETVAGSSITK